MSRMWVCSMDWTEVSGEVNKYLQRLRDDGVDDFVEYHRDILGEPAEPTELEGEEGLGTIWDLGYFRVAVQEGIPIGLTFELGDRVTEMDAWDEYLVAVGKPSERTLRARKVNELVDEMRANGVGRMEVPTTPDEDLRKFVLCYCDSQVYTDKDIPPGTNAGMVFMVLALGACQPPDEWWAEVGLPELGEKPEIPSPPSPPEPLKVDDPPPPPVPPVRVEPSEEKLAEIRSDIEWEEAREEEIDAYLASVEAENDRLLAEHEKALREYQEAFEQHAQELASLEARQDKVSLAHADEMARYEEETLPQAKEALAEWEAAEEEVRLHREAAMRIWTEDIGVVWEYMDQRGPMAVNGCPTFFSCRLMNKTDWERARKAILKELDRRKDFEL